MNRTQFTAKTEELISNLQKPLLEETIRLYDSGAIDTGKYGNDDYGLPKICLVMALGNIFSHFPLSDQLNREMRNLQKF